MYVEDYVSRVEKACDLNNGYPQGAPCYKIPAYTTNRVIFVNSPVYSSRLPSHNIANNLHNPISGNQVKGSNLCMANDSRSHYVNQDHKRDLGIVMHGSTQRDFIPYDRTVNNRLPSLNSVAASFAENTSSFNPRVQESYQRFMNAGSRQINHKQSYINPMAVNGNVRMSPPREKYSERNSHKQSKNKMMG